MEVEGVGDDDGFGNATGWRDLFLPAHGPCSFPVSDGELNGRRLGEGERNVGPVLDGEWVWVVLTQLGQRLESGGGVGAVVGGPRAPFQGGHLDLVGERRCVESGVVGSG